jgi:hypothetical protein
MEKSTAIPLWSKGSYLQVGSDDDNGGDDVMVVVVVMVYVISNRHQGLQRTVFMQEFTNKKIRSSESNARVSERGTLSRTVAIVTGSILVCPNMFSNTEWPNLGRLHFSTVKTQSEVVQSTTACSELASLFNYAVSTYRQC